MKKKNILFISHESSLYGAQRSLCDLILNLDKEKFSATVLVHRYGPLSKELENHGVRVRQVPFAWWVSTKMGPAVFIRALRNLMALFNVWRKGWLEDVDLVYTNTSVVPFGGLLSLFFGVPHIWHIREFATEDYLLKFDFTFPLSARFMNKTSSLIVFNSNAVSDKYKELLSRRKMTTVYNGILSLGKELSSFQGKSIESKSKITICIVGNISQSKGQLLAVEALKLTVENGGFDAHLRVVGTGPTEELDKVTALARQLNVDCRMTLEGYRTDVDEILAEADVCWVCSQAEAFGRVIVESMAAGTPVLASASGGIPEVIDNGITGILYPQGDAAALAQSTISLVNNAEIYRDISRRGYHAAYQKFNKERYTSELMSAISSVLGEVTAKV